jgi:hypothetical protein
MKDFCAPPNITNQVSLVSARKNKEPSPIMFKEDSDWIGLDTFSTNCLTNIINDFYPKPQRCNHRVLGVSNVPTDITYRGQVAYTITDDNGSTHKLHVPEMYYCATIPYRVPSPQCLDRQWRAHKLGTVCESTSGSGTVLHWTNMRGTQFTKTILHSD